MGFGEACRIANSEMVSDTKHLQKLQQLLRQEFTEKLKHVTVNGDLVLFKRKLRNNVTLAT